MLKKKILLTLFAIGGSFLLKAQEKKEETIRQKYPLEISVFNNGNFLPGGGKLGIWSAKIHPGIRIGTRFTYIIKKKSSLFQSAYLGYFFHKNAQHGLQLYTNFIYRYDFKFPLFMEAGIGAGYLHSFSDIDIFAFEDGVYHKKANTGRAQWMADFSIKAGYALTKNNLPFDVYLDYQFWLQSPFVNKYVPILPHNSLHLGFIYYWNH